MLGIKWNGAKTILRGCGDTWTTGVFYKLIKINLKTFHLILISTISNNTFDSDFIKRNIFNIWKIKIFTY